MTQIGEGVAIGGGKDPNDPDSEDHHWLELEYRYRNGAPIYGAFEATDSEGMLWTGRLNDLGQVCLAGLPPGNVQVNLLPEESDTDKELEDVRASIQATLDQIVADQRAEAEEYERELEQMGGARRAYTHIHAFGKGLWNGAMGLIEFVGDTAYKVGQVAVYLNPVNQLGNVLKAGYQSYQEGELTWDEWYDSVNENLQNEHQKDVARILGVEPDDLSAERLRELMSLTAEAYDIAVFLADDPDTYAILEQFATDMAEVQSSVEWAEFTGGGVFEIVLGVLLAVFTAGAGNAAQAASQLRHTSRLRSLAPLFRQLARLLRRKKINKEIDAPVDERSTTKTDQPDIIELTPNELPYTSHSEVQQPKAGTRIHKRVHEDGVEGDHYTLQSDGKPLGADRGGVPPEMAGMETLPSGHEEWVEAGWPTLNFRGNETFQTFSEARPVDLPPGTKIYRIVDEIASDAGGFWTYDLPGSKEDWRRGYAVKDSWNDNGYYVEHVVGENGLKVWEGKAAGQPYEEFEGEEFHLRGGDTQLFVTPGSISTEPPKLTNWPEW